MESQQQQQDTRPAKVLTTREIQQKLEENAMLLEAINERQNMNSLKDCVRFQEQLESNLRELASLLDTDDPRGQRTSSMNNNGPKA